MLEQPDIGTQEILAIAAQLVTFIISTIICGIIVRLITNSLSRLGEGRMIAAMASQVRKSARIVLVSVSVVGVFLLLAYDAYLILNHMDVYENTVGALQQVPVTVWIQFAVAAAKIIAYVIIATIVIRLLRTLIAKAEYRTKNFEQLTANDESIESFFLSVNRIQATGIWILVVYFSSRTIQLPDPISSACLLFLKLYVIVALALLIAKAITATVDSLDALSIKYASPDNFLRFYDKLRSLVPLFRRCLEFVLYAITASLVIAQIDPISKFAKHGVNVAKVIGIFFISRVVTEVSALVVDQLLLHDKKLLPEEKQRRKTLSPLIKDLLRYLILFGAFVLMLAALGINPTPILAGAGILGLVVGLGAQNVLNDVISGFFILFENLFLVGDFIKVDDAEGVVEEIDIRTTRIRNPDGQVHILRNGQMGQVVNYSKGFTYAVVEVGVAYDSNLDRVSEVLREAGEKLVQQNTDVIAPPEIQGLQNFGESELLMRTRTKVKPGSHLQVGRDYRMLIKETFDTKGIEIPFARRVLLFNKENLEALRASLPFELPGSSHADSK